jgi:DNA polymerase-3 subunit alpha (Gram-positive type)
MATAEIFIKFREILKAKQIETLDELNEYATREIDVKKLKTYHAIILVKSQQGLFNLYNLVTKSHIDYFFKKPRIPKSVYKKHSDGLILGSGCEAGELFKALLENKPQDQIDSIVSFYDYLEIQPLANNHFLLEKGKVQSYEELKNINRQIIQLGKRHNKKVVATGDIHFLDPDDEVYRRIIMTGQGYSDADNQPPLYFHTTDEFLKEFDYLGKETAYEVVIENPNLIADSIEAIKPIPDETFPPKIDGADEELVEITTKKAIELYGDPLPKPVKDRLDRELNSIIKNGFAVMYIIAQKLVWKSLEDGYLVGSRGSVGSSFVATMATITEVNPLSPHYVCRQCKYSDFDSPEVIKFAGGSGCDMPDKVCPVCGSMLAKEGHDIPFETFLGFDGDKEPDIDLNFSGEYQACAHAYTEELFGSSHVFKAGTIGTLAEKTAYGFVQKYLEEKNMKVAKAEIGRLISGCTGIKRTTGQHPGGLMVVPRDNNIHNFCPVQRPANDMKSTVTTTHFDYHSISGRLLKLDILGHDDPTIIRMLEDLTGLNATQIPLDDKKTISLFTTTEALGVTREDINSEVGSLGIPEFGTKFVRQMLVDTKPTTFSELIRISGLSHGTDVWLNNAQELVRQGTATLSEVISTRDDIMVYLIIEGVEKKGAFKIMECVRKGKGLTEEQEDQMKKAGVKQWYIDSCKKIKYMFPKAHAAAYVMMAFRIAYFKVYYPEAFYTAYFSIRAKGNFDYELMCHGREVAEMAIKELEQRQMLSTKEKDTLTVLEMVREMYARGIKFNPIDLYKSDSERFIIEEDGILPPFNSLQGLGDTAAKNIVEKRKQGEFLSIEQFRNETKVSSTIIDLMKKNGILNGIPDTSQLTLF